MERKACPTFSLLHETSLAHYFKIVINFNFFVNENPLCLISRYDDMWIVINKLQNEWGKKTAVFKYRWFPNCK